jgi:hypothetical protein
MKAHPIDFFRRLDRQLEVQGIVLIISSFLSTK